MMEDRTVKDRSAQVMGLSSAALFGVVLLLNAIAL